MTYFHLSPAYHKKKKNWNFPERSHTHTHPHAHTHTHTRPNLPPEFLCGAAWRPGVHQSGLWVRPTPQGLAPDGLLVKDPVKVGISTHQGNPTHQAKQWESTGFCWGCFLKYPDAHPIPSPAEPRTSLCTLDPGSLRLGSPWCPSSESGLDSLKVGDGVQVERDKRIMDGFNWAKWTAAVSLR